MSLALRHPKESPTRQIIEYLQRHNSATIKDLELLLGVTTTAVRQHLGSLLGEGYIRRQSIHAGVGRPAHAYVLAEKARELFACHCDDLALTLLQEVFVVEGAERAQLLLDRVGDRLAARYAGSVRALGLRDRVGEMAAALEQRGVLTDIAGPDANTIVLTAYNCPFHELAQEHREICAMDEKMMQQVLGTDVSLSSCIMDGHARCSFVVRGADGHSADGRSAGVQAAARREGKQA